MTLDKVVGSAREAVSDIPAGASLAVGGFGLCGIPMVLIQALLETGVDDLKVASNNCGVDDWGLGVLLAQKRISKMTSSYVGENKEFERQYLAGEPREFVLEEAITTDFALVHALKGDRYGNLVFDKSARNFSPLAAMAGRVCIAQIEELVEVGELDPDAVHLPGVFVHRVVEVGPDAPKRIERRTVRPAPSTTNQEG